MTKTTRMTSLVSLLVLVILARVYYLHEYKKISVTTIEPVAPAPFSLKGCYTASLAKDFYTLSILSEEPTNVTGVLAFNNYEKDSSSGTFNGTFKNGVLLGNYSFQSEGMHSDRQVIFKKIGDDLVEGFGPVKMVDGKEVFENIATVKYDPKSTFVKSVNCIEHFNYHKNTFTFDYNSLFQAIVGDQTPTTDWRINSTDKGMLLTTVNIPRTYMPMTNFSGAKFTVGRSKDANIIKNCTNTAGLINQENKGDVATQTSIDGHPFIKFNTGDAGAGNFYETTSYRGVLNGYCYDIEYTIHSTSIGAYSPDQGIKQFDNTKIESELDNIIKSFKFIVKK